MDEDFKKLLEENIAKNEEVYQISKKIKKYLVMGQILSILRLLFIVIPLILAILYLPSLLSGAWSNYQGLLDATAGAETKLPL